MEICLITRSEYQSAIEKFVPFKDLNLAEVSTFEQNYSAHDEAEHENLLLNITL
jgi:hypothetical protein